MTVARGADPEELPSYTDQLKPSERTIEGTIERWDRAQGTFNHMEGGQGDMLRAAGLLLKDNFTGTPGEFGVTRRGEDSVYGAFSDLLDNIDLSEQAPTPTLLLAGELIHKAAWTEPDAKRQQRLFDGAEAIYTRIYEDPKAPWQDHKFRAGQYRSDIRFHVLSAQIREAVAGGDIIGKVSNLRREAMDMLREQIGDMNEMRLLALKADGANKLEERNDWAGAMFEQFIQIALRHQIYLQGNIQTAGHYEVRRAFHSEDRPVTPKISIKKQQFDLVVQHYDNDGNVEETTPIQLKLRQHADEREDSKTAEEEAAAYTPEILFIRVTDLTPEGMRRIGEDMVRAYVGNDPKRDIESLRRLQGRFSPMFAAHSR